VVRALQSSLGVVTSTTRIDTPPARDLRPVFPLSLPTIGALLALSTGSFLVFPSLLWRAARDESHLLRFAFSYFAIVPLAAIALHRVHRLKLDSLVTIVAMVWGAKLVVTALLYQFVGTSRRAELHAPDPNESKQVAATTAAPAVDAASAVALSSGRIFQGGRPVPNAIVSVCNAAPSDTIPSDRPAAIRAGVLSPALVDASLGDRLAFTNDDTAPHALHGVATGVSAFSLAVVPGRPSNVELSTAGAITIEVDGRPIGAVVVFEHALHARTSFDGRFQIAEVPVGPRALCVFVGAPPVMHVVHAIVPSAEEPTFDIGSSS
jgi:hypothetical protein